MNYRIENSDTPTCTCTAPYIVLRKRRLFGWKYIGRSRNNKEAHGIIDSDFEHAKRKPGEWAVVTGP